MTRHSLIWTATLVLLALSLAGNFFLLGYAAHGLRQGGAGRVLMTEIAGAYPPEVRKEFRSILRENRQRTFSALRELRVARANLAAAQDASPFDEAAVKDAMAAVRTATTNLQATMQDYLLTALKNIKAKPAAGS
ncbi:periplasmic heavy metal sensor [Mesorhizobium sp.]|uniref:periplasmic heavy metal sensor n=1 Tax=Mesorhizobium sp. TaxID=1871066 RepID=UPI0011FE0085|nr:periplasmic heavy metal sensor [Mesorhizobium sp.]TIO10660.1 MAG: periplasmic heavy metal sensor [Mesorhizobium sp.]TIO35396.1 MAG: periplasmic heavy metal sensor [Mesorhizobium sp.]